MWVWSVLMAPFVFILRKFGRHVVVRTCNGSELRETIGDNGEYMRRTNRSVASNFGTTRCVDSCLPSSSFYYFFIKC